MEIRFGASVRPRTLFKHIEPGSCYMLPAGETVYMKLSQGACQYVFAAVNLANGNVYSIDPNKAVVPVVAEVDVLH